MKKFIRKMLSVFTNLNGGYYMYPTGPTPIIYVKYKNNILVV